MPASRSFNVEASSGSNNAAGGCAQPSQSVYETRYQKSLRHYLTREALPTESHYRNLQSIYASSKQRPTLDDLHNSTYTGGRSPGDEAGASDAAPDKDGGKTTLLGWIKGVMMPCMLNIWGVMLFLRLSWVVGQAGLGLAIFIVCAANVVTLITALSMSAVATNGLIEGGGVYYMISRSLGPEFGASIGLMFTLANSIAVATYIIGFVNSLQDMLFFYMDGLLMLDGGLNDVRAIGTGTLILLTLLGIVGMSWVTRVQIVLLFLLIGSQIDFVVGAFMGPPSDLYMSRGFIGFSGELFVANIQQGFRWAEGTDQNLFSVFAVFFPAVTGIVAGANLSGDLKDPGQAIPQGTLLAILVTFLTYIAYPFLLAASVTRDASGNVTELLHYMQTDAGYLSGNKSILDAPNFNGESCSVLGPNTPHPLNLTSCEFGLMNNFQVMEMVSAFGPIIYAGCFAATLSSAVASLVGAPRVLQALAKDELYPFIHIFAKGYGVNNDPIRGYCLVFLIAFGCIMIGELNAVSTILSNFFLASYALINFSCFHASMIKSPGWRPAFKYYSPWASVAGCIMCVAVMFLIDYITALITFIVVFALWLFVSVRKPDVNWGSSTQAAIYKAALKNVLELQRVEEHVKNYRPQILVLSGPPSARPPLVDFAHTITKNISLLMCGHVTKKMDFKQRSAILARGNCWLMRHNIRGFFNVVEDESFEHGAMGFFQLSGIGKLKPNMVMLGHKADWNTCPKEELLSYFHTLHGALNMQLAVAILRVPSGLDYSDLIDDESGPVKAQNGGPAVDQQAQATDQGETNSVASSPPGTPDVERGQNAVAGLEGASEKGKKKKKGDVADVYKGKNGTKLNKDILNEITFFQRKQKKGTIDVWWLYDDGGLTLLIPYIIMTRSKWEDCELRIFTLANKKDQLDMEQRSMASLLSKFRIDYDDVIVIPEVIRKASPSSRADFDALIEKFKTEEDVGDGVTLTESELVSQNEKTNRHIRLRETLLENSMDANLIVMTLPLPRKGHVSASLYMAWLEYITKDMPPFLFVRGNQQSVLTFYS